MRLLGIDYGTKRVGLALTDAGGQMAFPHMVLPNDGALRKEIERIITEQEVGRIVIGHSLSRKGEPNPVHTAVEELIQDLTLATGLPVELEPEQYTTQEAISIQGKNTLVDASAAAIILNSYLSKHS